jgi:hypothetical protein
MPARGLILEQQTTRAPEGGLFLRITAAAPSRPLHDDELCAALPVKRAPPTGCLVRQLRNRLAPPEFDGGLDQEWKNMTFGYVRPFSFTIAPPSAIHVASVRHGVTEISLSDGRLVRATLHVKDVKINAHPGTVDISYNVVAEVVAIPSVPILDVHETIQ